MKEPRKFFISVVMSLVLLLLPLVHLSSEQYYKITETQLQELETQLEMYETLNDNLKQQIKEQEKSLKKSESKNLRTNITIGAVSFSVGVVGGMVILYSLSK